MSATSCHLGQDSSEGGGDVLYGIGMFVYPVFPLGLFQVSYGIFVGSPCLRALPPLLAPVMAPSIPRRAAFSVDPSFHPLWDAISWMVRFPTIPSSSNSRFLSSTFVLSKISLSLFKLSSVFLFSFSMSCFWFSLSVMVMVPLDMADLVVVPAFPLTGMVGT